MHPRELLIDTYPHIPPAGALENLSAADAERHVAGATHSVAEIVAHMAFWQEWFCDRCDGLSRPMAAPASLGWPAAPPGSWPDIQARFLAGLERAAAFGDGDMGRLVAPAIEFPPLAQYSVRDALVHIAQHNAHHLGQVILLRQMMACWPPPSGSWTW
jgi:uncharacterized damage-inducible protein DinB